MPPYIPKWFWYLAGGILVIVAIYFAAEYIDAATSLLPGG
jgi:hypothetical protein